MDSWCDELAAVCYLTLGNTAMVGAIYRARAIRLAVRSRSGDAGEKTAAEDPMNNFAKVLAPIMRGDGW